LESLALSMVIAVWWSVASKILVSPLSSGRVSNRKPQTPITPTGLWSGLN
jgi:hypothetical protein